MTKLLYSKRELWLCTSDSGLRSCIKQAVPGTAQLPRKLRHYKLTSLHSPSQNITEIFAILPILYCEMHKPDMEYKKKNPQVVFTAT